MIALLDKRLVYPVRVFEQDEAKYGDPWKYFLALDPCPNEPGVCELIGWDHRFMFDAEGVLDMSTSRACVELCEQEGFEQLKSTHYVNGQPRVKYLKLKRGKNQ